jgi:hypothetical protein
MALSFGKGKTNYPFQGEMWPPSVFVEMTPLEVNFYQWLDQVIITKLYQSDLKLEDTVESIQGLKVEELGEELFEEWITEQEISEWLN